ncbi:ThuA domain-containing protein [Glaciecola sp. 1036]|uniref:ThuA domain-containing protein n=1 Tax=Alteromonadaceae TaxID=72275 RepID=UPI003D02199D
MNRIKKLVICGIALLVVQGTALANQFNVLLFTKTAGWHHESINDAIPAMRGLAQRHNFSLEWHEDASRFNDDFLAKFDVIVFINTTGDILNDQQQKAFQKFIQSGKGFVGVHSASDTEYDWPWYGKLVGHYFKIHPVIQTAIIENIDNSFPGMQAVRSRHLWTDEFYDFRPANIDSLNYIMSIDENTYSAEVKWGDLESKGMGDFHPMAWYHEYDGGRSFYTALGHLPAVYKDQVFLEHLYGGIYWAATGKGIEKK